MRTVSFNHFHASIFMTYLMMKSQFMDVAPLITRQVAWCPRHGRIPLEAAGTNVRDATKVWRPRGGTSDAGGFYGSFMMV